MFVLVCLGGNDRSQMVRSGQALAEVRGPARTEANDCHKPGASPRARLLVLGWCWAGEAVSEGGRLSWVQVRVGPELSPKSCQLLDADRYPAQTEWRTAMPMVSSWRAGPHLAAAIGCLYSFHARRLRVAVARCTISPERALTTSSSAFSPDRSGKS